jgi:hypothetical protein
MERKTEDGKPKWVKDREWGRTTEIFPLHVPFFRRDGEGAIRQRSRPRVEDPEPAEPACRGAGGGRKTGEPSSDHHP